MLTARRISPHPGIIPSREQIQKNYERQCWSIDQFLAFGCRVMHFFDIKEGAVGIIHDRTTGEIKRITFDDRPYIHLPYGWCAPVNGDGIVSLHEIGVLLSAAIDPDQKAVVAHADEGNLRSLESELLSLGQNTSVVELRKLYKELTWD